MLIWLINIGGPTMRNLDTFRARDPPARENT